MVPAQPHSGSPGCPPVTTIFNEAGAAIARAGSASRWRREIDTDSDYPERISAVKGHMRGLSVCLLITAFACVAMCQEFEVASVKPNTSGERGSHMNSDGGRIRITNASMRGLITTAYGVREYQVEGPDWLDNERYDVNAKFSEELPKDPEKYNAVLQSMMQKLLAERFKLAAHRDKKTTEVYGLVVGKSGIKFKPSEETDSHTSRSTGVHYEGSAIEIARLGDFLGRRLDLPVVDMTGLKGYYNIKMDWVPDPKQPAGEKGNAPLLPESQAGPTLRDAVTEQLGLKLESRKAPIEILVIDHVERVPTEN
jgi:uncharacterized protein (TIGR03435 family)